jgi:hypothetical protein
MTIKKIELHTWIITLIRIFIGWQFLYERLVRLFNPNWSAAPCLLESTWIFSGFFSLDNLLVEWIQKTRFSGYEPEVVKIKYAK